MGIVFTNKRNFSWPMVFGKRIVQRNKKRTKKTQKQTILNHQRSFGFMDQSAVISRFFIQTNLTTDWTFRINFIYTNKTFLQCSSIK